MANESRAEKGFRALETKRLLNMNQTERFPRETLLLVRGAGTQREYFTLSVGSRLASSLSRLSNVIHLFHVVANESRAEKGFRALETKRLLNMNRTKRFPRETLLLVRGAGTERENFTLSVGSCLASSMSRLSNDIHLFHVVANESRAEKGFRALETKRLLNMNRTKRFPRETLLLVRGAGAEWENFAFRRQPFRHTSQNLDVSPPDGAVAPSYHET